MTWYVYICMFLLLLLPLQTTSTLLEQERSIRSVLNVPDPENNFTHIAVYDQDTIFVGGTNYIYRVSTGNLSIEKLEKIGPNHSNSIGQDCYNDNSCEEFKIREMCFLQFYAGNDSMHLNRNLQYLISIYWYVQKS